MAMIDLDNVGLTFTIRQNKHITLKEYLVRGMLFRSLRTPGLKVHALNSVSLQAKDGDRIGVIGHNGAGKSTLLKLLAGIYPATRGRVRVDGRICSLFDITLGFEPDATGWENISYRAYLQGESPASLKKKIQGIADFSELGEFLDVPIRYYSAGMMMRLAFSIATAVDPEVLLIDEVLATGDLAFQTKARERMNEMKNASRLMVLVAHDLGTIEAMCNRTIWLQHGTMHMEGPTKEVVAAYIRSVTVPQPVPVPPAPAQAAAA